MTNNVPATMPTAEKAARPKPISKKIRAARPGDRDQPLASTGARDRRGSLNLGTVSQPEGERKGALVSPIRSSLPSIGLGWDLAGDVDVFLVREAPCCHSETHGQHHSCHQHKHG
jgi:hypothetical protein